MYSLDPDTFGRILICPPRIRTPPHGIPKVEFKAVINDPKSGKSHARTISGNIASQLPTRPKP